MPFKYRWKHTWPEKGKDFHAFDGPLCIGRFYWTLFTEGRGTAMWQWGLNGLRFPAQSALAAEARGFMTGSATDVAVHMEALYDRLLPLCDHVDLQTACAIEFFDARGLPSPPCVVWEKAHYLDGHSMAEAFEISGIPEPRVQPYRAADEENRRRAYYLGSVAKPRPDFAI